MNFRFIIFIFQGCEFLALVSISLYAHSFLFCTWYSSRYFDQTSYLEFIPSLFTTLSRTVSVKKAQPMLLNYLCDIDFFFSYPLRLLIQFLFCRKYKPIESYEQRCKYKQDFQTQYKEYIELKKIVDSVSRKFLELDQSRKKYPEDSEKGQVTVRISLLFFISFHVDEG